MTDAMRVILEVGKQRRVVAGAMDWPGLDRWGTSEDDALEKLSAYVPRYADVAERAGLATAFARAARDRGRRARPRIELDRFLGHRPRPVRDRARGPLAEDLDRRLGLLEACWAYFDDAASHAPTSSGPEPRSAGRTRDQIVRHVYLSEPDQLSRKVEVRTPLDVVPTPDGPRRASRGVPRSHPRLQRPGQTGPDLADPVPDPADRIPRHGPRLGDRGPRTRSVTNALAA